MGSWTFSSSSVSVSSLSPLRWYIVGFAFSKWVPPDILTTLFYGEIVIIPTWTGGESTESTSSSGVAQFAKHGKHFRENNGKRSRPKRSAKPILNRHYVWKKCLISERFKTTSEYLLKYLRADSSFTLYFFLPCIPSVATRFNRLLCQGDILIERESLLR